MLVLGARGTKGECLPIEKWEGEWYVECEGRSKGGNDEDGDWANWQIECSFISMLFLCIAP